MTSNTNATIDELRDLLYGEPDEALWQAVCELFDRWPASSVTVGIDYARRHLDARWPDRLRVPPAAWRAAALNGRLPAAWPLVRAFDVRLLHCGAVKIGVIKVVREHTGLGLKETKDLVEAAPTLVLTAVGLDAANALINGLAELRAAIQPPEAELLAHASDARVMSDGESELARGAWDVILTDVSNLIQAIKVVRELTFLGLAEAKGLVDRRPSTILKAAPHHKAEEARAALEAVGATVELVRVGGSEASTPAPTGDAVLGQYGVELVSVGRNKIEVIRLVFDGRGDFRTNAIGLAEAKRLAESTPCTVVSGLTRATAEAFVAALERAGAMADVIAARG